MFPSGSTTVSDRTLSRIVPYCTAHVPEALDDATAGRNQLRQHRHSSTLAGTQGSCSPPHSAHQPRTAWPPCRRGWRLRPDPQGRTGRCRAGGRPAGAASRPPAPSSPCPRCRPAGCGVRSRCWAKPRVQLHVPILNRHCFPAAASVPAPCGSPTGSDSFCSCQGKRRHAAPPRAPPATCLPQMESRACGGRRLHAQCGRPHLWSAGTPLPARGAEWCCGSHVDHAARSGPQVCAAAGPQLHLRRDGLVERLIVPMLLRRCGLGGQTVAHNRPQLRLCSRGRPAEWAAAAAAVAAAAV